MTRFADPSVIACPTCDTLMLVRNVASINLDTPTGPSWSDGFGSQHWSAYLMVDLVCCDCCNHLFWTADAERLGAMPKRPESLNWPLKKRMMMSLGIGFQSVRVAETEWKTVKDEWHWAQPAVGVKENALLWALERGAGNTLEREIILRRRLWWANNHPRRGRTYLPPMTIDQERQNLLRLLELYRQLPDEKQQPLTQGELLRELGLFDESIMALECTPEEGSQRAALLIRLARDKNSLVHEFISSEGGK